MQANVGQVEEANHTQVGTGQVDPNKSGIGEVRLGKTRKTLQYVQVNAVQVEANKYGSLQVR